MRYGATDTLMSTIERFASQQLSGLAERLFDIGHVGGGPGIGDFLYYSLIYKFVQYEIRGLGPAIFDRMTGVAVSAALVLMTIWIMYNGYRILTGQSRESIAAFALTTARAAFIIIFASSMALFGRDFHTLITEDMSEGITELVTGNNDSPAQLIEQNMALSQAAIFSIDALQVATADEDQTLESEKTRSIWMAGFGAAGPAVTSGVILLMFEVAIALFIGFGPFFVLFLLSDKTSQFFWKWLWYGIGTMFALGVFVAMSSIALKVIGAVAGSLWGASLLTGMTGATSAEGLTAMAMQQGGIGLLLTLLLVSVPPIAANFFQGALGAASTYNVFRDPGGQSQHPPGGSPHSGARQQPTSATGTGDGGGVAWNPGGSQLATQYGGGQSQQNTGNLGPGKLRADGNPTST